MLIDEYYQIIHSNDALRKQLGISKEELSDQAIWIFFKCMLVPSEFAAIPMGTIYESFNWFSNVSIPWNVFVRKLLLLLKVDNYEDYTDPLAIIEGHALRRVPFIDLDMFLGSFQGNVGEMLLESLGSQIFQRPSHFPILEDIHFTTNCAWANILTRFGNLIHNTGYHPECEIDYEQCDGVDMLRQLASSVNYFIEDDGIEVMSFAGWNDPYDEYVLHSCSQEHCKLTYGYNEFSSRFGTDRAKDVPVVRHPIFLSFNSDIKVSGKRAHRDVYNRIVNIPMTNSAMAIISTAGLTEGLWAQCNDITQRALPVLTALAERRYVPIQFLS